MPELINRNHAEQAIEAYLCSRCERNDNEVCHNCPHIDGDEILKSVPTIEAKPARCGRWIPIEYDSYADGAPVWDKWECSNCGHEHNGEKDTLTAFCPDCGFDMTGDSYD